MFYSADGNFINNNIIEKFTDTEKENNLEMKINMINDELNKKIDVIHNENSLLKKKIDELTILTKKLEIEKTDYFYLNSKN